MRKYLYLLLLATLVLTAVNTANAKSFKRVKDTRPEIWRKNSGKKTMAAEEMARLDAASKIIAYINGIQIAEDVTIGSYGGDSKNVTASVEGIVKYAREGEFEYNEDGTCTLEVSVSYADIYKLTKVVQKQYFEDCDGCGEPTDELLAVSVKEFSIDRDLTVLGIGGIAGTGAREIVKGIRGAEVNAYAKYAEYLSGINITRNTKLSDFINISDELKGEVEGIAKGLEFELPELREDENGNPTQARITGMANFKKDLDVIKMALKIVFGKIKGKDKDLSETLKQAMDTGEMEEQLKQAVRTASRKIKVVGTYDFNAVAEEPEEIIEDTPVSTDRTEELEIEVIESQKPVFTIE